MRYLCKSLKYNIYFIACLNTGLVNTWTSHVFKSSATSYHFGQCNSKGAGECMKILSCWVEPERERTCWKICRWNQWRRQSGNSWVLSSKQGLVAKSFLSYCPEAKWGIFFFSSHIETQHFHIVLWIVSIVVWSLSTFGNKEAFVTGHQMLECCFYGKDFRILKLIHYLFLECHLLLIVKGIRLESKL